jgi:enamine deaminase RidA (YjgF/YER057c/UK114 family)
MRRDPLARLSQLHITLPSPPAPGGAYIATSAIGNLVFTSGQIAVDGEHGLIAAGKVGATIDADTAIACARQCAINLLAHLHQACGGLHRIDHIAKLTVFVASAPTLTQQPVVANGASELLTDVLGDAGAHTRSAIGVAALPLDSPVEIEAVVQMLDMAVTRDG